MTAAQKPPKEAAFDAVQKRYQAGEITLGEAFDALGGRPTEADGAHRYGWEDFELDESTDAIPGKLILTITDDGEEIAVIVHRTVPTIHNERIMDAKRERAQIIVDALNAQAVAR